MDPEIHEIRLRVRYAETDQMGVVHHANFLVYLEESRTLLMNERGCSYAELERSGVGLPVRRTELRYRAPARYDEELLVRTRVGRVTRACVTFESEVLRAFDETSVAQGYVELACVDLRASPPRPMALPSELIEKLHAGSQRSQR